MSWRDADLELTHICSSFMQSKRSSEGSFDGTEDWWATNPITLRWVPYQLRVYSFALFTLECKKNVQETEEIIVIWRGMRQYRNSRRKNGDYKVKACCGSERIDGNDDDQLVNTWTATDHLQHTLNRLEEENPRPIEAANSADCRRPSARWTGNRPSIRYLQRTMRNGNINQSPR